MKRRLGFMLWVGVLLSTVGVWWSCSELKEGQGPLDADQQLEVHPAGWMDVAQEGFHGKVLAKGGWEFAPCQGCHGTDYKGGITDSSCLTCHVGGLQTCITCHGDFSGDVNKPFNWAPPKDMANHVETTFRGVGAHQTHVRYATLRVTLDCSECHLKPTKVDDPGHLDSDLPAEIAYGELARNEGAEPFWDPDGAQCNNVYCHGEFKYGNRDNNLIWTNVGVGQAACGTCHGLPPPSETGHVQMDQCSLCHSNVVDEDGNIKDRTLHINGKVDF